MVWFTDNIFAAESPVMTRLQCCGWCGVALVAGYITPAQNGLVCRQYICRRVAGDDKTTVLWKRVQLLCSSAPMLFKKWKGYGGVA